MHVPDFALRLLRAFPDAAVFVSSRGQLRSANASARETLGVAEQSPVGCTFAGVLGVCPEELADTLRTWSRSTEPTPGSFIVKRGTSAKTFNAKGSVVIPAAEDTDALILIRFWPREEANPFLLLSQQVSKLNHEVVRRVQVEEALRRSEAALRLRAEEAEALNRMKDEFLATVSHELRTPLNAILGWASLLRNSVGEKQLTKGLEVIHRNAEAQAKLIDDILDVSRIIKGNVLLDVKLSDLKAIVEDAIEVVGPSAGAKQIEIKLVCGTEPWFLIADPDRLRQVAWNLLSNATKFTAPGGSIRVALERRGAHFALIVADNGKGIEPSFLPFIFDRFTQADGSTTRREGGLGLGLAIVRHLVELHGGTVEVCSEGAGKGASFTVVLPIDQLKESSASPKEGREHPLLPPQRAQPLLHGLRILIVDDEPDARELTATILTEGGAHVDAAASAAEALNAIGTFRPHLIVSDIGMPVEDGYSFMQRFRQLADAAGGDIPTIALTAYERAEDRARARASGFTAYLSKPVNPQDLLATVAKLARRT